jgi:hypothetical protein
MLLSLQYVVNLTTGEINKVPAQVSFTKVPNSVKSSIEFLSAKPDEGFLNLFFVHIDNNNSFLFLLGNVLSTRIFVGGNFLHGTDTIKLDKAVLPKYIDKNIKSWKLKYKLGDIVGILTSTNLLMQDVYKLVK